MGRFECDGYETDVRLDDLTHNFHPLYSHVLIMSLIYLDRFRSADVFNGDISQWDVSSVTDMSYM